MPPIAPTSQRAAPAFKPVFCCVSAIARRLGVSKRYLYTLIRQGELEAVRPCGRRLLVPSEAVDRMIERWQERRRREIEPGGESPAAKSAGDSSKSSQEASR